PYHEAVKNAERIEIELAEVLAQATLAFNKALAFNRDDREARELLSDLYADRFVDAEQRSDSESMAFFRNLVQRYHDGKYEHLFVESNPPGAEIVLYPYEQQGLVLAKGAASYRGTTPSEVRGLEPGSYVAELAAPGFRTCRYPVFLEKGKRWQGRVVLYRDEEIGPGFIFVPEGGFIRGGDENAFPSEAEQRKSLKDFFIMERHVTVRDYLEFIRDLDKKNRKEAEKRIPRRGSRVTAAPFGSESRTRCPLPARTGSYLPSW
ncbi:SUMF1/EgtB/PvdO family nonheme iron enzyme, partial [Acidobacteriota bacterium]